MSSPPLKPLLLSDYTYELPADRIAVRPVAERDASRLLVARCTPKAELESRGKGLEDQGHKSEAITIEHHHFRNLPSFLPEHSLVVVNTSKVFRARLRMQKPTGGAAEVLLIAPTDPSQDPLSSSDPSEWECLIGGRHIQPPMVLSTADGALSATIISRDGTEGVALLSWNSNEVLADVLERYGEMPLPPYLGRNAEDDDAVRYQTVYADKQGSAAAPTAGLHFTKTVFDALDAKRIEHIDLSLHVGLGTFKPIEVEDVRDHVMHTERIDIHRNAIEAYVRHATSSQSFVTVVGTTSLRALESVYWFGVELLATPSTEDRDGVPRRAVSDGQQHMHVDQWAAFRHADKTESTRASLLPSRAHAFATVRQWMQDHGLDVLSGSTSIMLAPGCHIATADALVTNFHQPGNTLLLLVAAFVGDTNWRKIYNAAIDEGYRFLSYGDSSVMIRSTAPCPRPL